MTPAFSFLSPVAPPRALRSRRSRAELVGLLGGAGLALLAAIAPAVRAQDAFYQPISLPEDNQISDTLSEKDIPTGQGSFARDYQIELTAGDRVEIALTSDSFDTIVKLMGSDGSTIAENDDGPDGTTNSLLFLSIQTSDTYTIRVQAFGKSTGGPFDLAVTRLRPAQ